MILGIQLLGIAFGLFMCFFTFLHYKKRNFGIRSFTIWLFIWVSFLITILFPGLINSFRGILDINRTMDFYVIFGFFGFTVIIFYMYIIVKKTEKKVERLVRKLAFDNKK